jgi:hypothetical protein
MEKFIKDYLDFSYRVFYHAHYQPGYIQEVIYLANPGTLAKERIQ